MRYFWKIYASIFFVFSFAIALVFYILVSQQFEYAKQNLMDESTVISSFLMKDIEVAYSESEWPFESLKKLTERSNFLFWWITRENGMIYLADNASFMETSVFSYFPDIKPILKDRVSYKDGYIYLNYDKSYGIFVGQINTNKENFVFLHGFSLNSLFELRNGLLRLTAIIFFITIGFMDITLYFVVAHFISPINQLTKAIEDISLGKMDTQIKGKERNDEIGALAKAFDRTIVSLKLAMKQSGFKSQTEPVTEETLLNEKLIKKNG
jgi:HAMP domain-containing protein